MMDEFHSNHSSSSLFHYCNKGSKKYMYVYWLVLNEFNDEYMTSLCFIISGPMLHLDSFILFLPP